MKNVKIYLTDLLANVLAKVIVTLILVSAFLVGLLDAEAAQAAVHWLYNLLPFDAVATPSGL